MSDTHDGVREHYEVAITDPDGLLATLTDFVDGIAGPVTATTLADLDQFHFGGLAATAALAQRVVPSPEMQVLDAGSGLGGPSRYLAETFGCRVTGVDLTPAYVAIASLLSRRAGFDALTNYRVGNLTALPFADAGFDLVWSQHVVMNIRDHHRLYGEVRRVLRPGGRFAFYDPIAADAAPGPHFPLPWADTPAASTLLIEDETVAALLRAGLQVTRWDDVGQEALGWMGQRPPSTTAGTFDVATVVGGRMSGMAANFARNLREGRLRLAMGVCTAV